MNNGKKILITSQFMDIGTWSLIPASANDHQARSYRQIYIYDTDQANSGLQTLMNSWKIVLSFPYNLDEVNT